MYEELVKRLKEPCQYENCVLCQEAADAIEELSMKLHGDEAAIAGMKREIERMVVGGVPRWIPVTERLPNVDTNKSGYETVTVLVTVQGWKNAQPMTYQRACVRDKTVYRWKIDTIISVFLTQRVRNRNSDGSLCYVNGFRDFEFKDWKLKLEETPKTTYEV